jgi:RHH-type proline utilization regulon transcriptional repressor/proline dehydrogenase/delta 1-pyrroline-5-carboxylate dehydrogenase
MAMAATLDMGPIDLPGPTGESNRLSLVPRGTVLCLGPDAETVMDQTVQALRAGNAVLAVAPGAGKALAALMDAGLPVTTLDGRLDPAAIADLALDAVAYLGGEADMRGALASREGAILPLISARLDPVAYAHERVVCIDTTAAGGNATLLAEAS